MRLRLKGPALVVLVVAVASLCGLLASGWSPPPTGADGFGTFLAIDAGTGDNTSTSVGSISDCFEVAPGATYTLDVVIVNATDVVAAQLTLHYPPGAVTARAVTDSLLNEEQPDIGSSADIDPEASSTLPDNHGAHLVVVSNDPAIGSGGASGSGILIRFTLTAPAVVGAYALSVSDSTLNDRVANELAHHTHGATLVVGGGPCPSTLTPCPACTPIPTPTPAPTAVPTSAPAPCSECKPTSTPSPTPTPCAECTPTPTPTPSSTPPTTPSCGWTVVDSPSPVNFDALYAVEDVSANDIWAVGTSQARGSPVQPLIEHWDGLAWTVVGAPSLQGPSGLFSLSAVSANDVWAIGQFNNGVNIETLTAHWDSSQWKVIPSPNPGPHSNNFVYDVEAISASDVWAVGVSADPYGSASQILLLHLGRK